QPRPAGLLKEVIADYTWALPSRCWPSRLPPDSFPSATGGGSQTRRALLSLKAEAAKNTWPSPESSSASLWGSGLYGSAFPFLCSTSARGSDEFCLQSDVAGVCSLLCSSG